MTLIMSGCDVTPPMITNVCCNQCDVSQPPSEACINCKLVFGRTYCDECMLWTKLDIHHCEGCGLCRVGRVENSFHCDKCHACFLKEHEAQHQCLKVPLKEQKCAICCCDLHNSQRPTTVLRCGHGGMI